MNAQEYTVYLHPEYFAYLQYFGEPEKVIDKILGCIQQEDMLYIPELPSPPPRGNASKYTFNITNKYYNDIRNAPDVNTKLWSLRRLIYYIVDNDTLNEWGWPQVNPYSTSNLKRVANQLSIAVAAMRKVTWLLPNEDISSIYNQLCELWSKYHEHGE